MKTIKIKTNKNCRRIRAWLYAAFSRHFSPEADWLNEHIMRCPRCQRRLISHSRVDLALSFMKSRPHNLDLLMRANTQAIGVLKHSLRLEPKAQKLKRKLPEPKLLERCGKYGNSVANMAACILILLLMKIGIFSSMDTFHNRGQKAIRQYYSNQLGEYLADEIFPQDAEHPSSAYSGGSTNA